jgi:hypothetical protein
LRHTLVTVLSVGLLTAGGHPLHAANHREAPITALDHKADITDVFAFRAYDTSQSRTVLIMNVDPLLEPGNGPNYFPFDPEIDYAINVDNDQDAVADVTFVFQFKTEFRLPEVFTAYVGAGNGIGGIVPPAVTALEGPGAQGIGVRQTYTVTLVKDGRRRAIHRSDGGRLFAVPSNVGPRTMPRYDALARQGIYSVDGDARVFAGTVDDPFYIDLGSAFDSLNFRNGGVLTAAEDADDTRNFRSYDYVSGYNVNTIALEVPTDWLTSDGALHGANDPKAVIGVWATTSRPQITVRRSPKPAVGVGPSQQVQRMGIALDNELLIGTGFKDFFSMSQPKNDAQFSRFYLRPLLGDLFRVVFGLPVPTGDRTDLLPLVQYLPPIAPKGTRPGPIADLLRLNTGVEPTAAGQRKRLGLLANDGAGYPNGRRVFDDVLDISARAVAGALAGVKLPAVGDGVNTNDRPYQETFPYVAFANSGFATRSAPAGGF